MTVPEAVDADRKLSHDIVWSLGSFAILALSGISINFAVAAMRDAAALGVFNLAYAIYVIASQVAVSGVHYSVLRLAAHLSDSPEERRFMLWAAIALSGSLGLAWGAAVYLAAPLFEALFGSPASARAISLTGFGLALFPLNKVLISYINGLRHMRAFALLQATRYLLVMAWVIGVAASTLPFEYAALAFIVAEGTTTLAAALYLQVAGLLTPRPVEKRWVLEHLSFGFRSLPSGMFLELNTRVDVIVIGIFLTDREVGIYSFAAMLVDGLYHVLAMIRVNMNPILVAGRRTDSWTESRRLLGVARRYLLPVAFALSAAIVVGYLVVVNYVLSSSDLAEGIWPLVILLASLSLVSAYVPFDNLLMVSGYPGHQTLQNLGVVFINIALNIALVPVIGIVGAAIGTAASYLAGFIALMYLASRLLGWNLLTNTTTTVDASANPR